MAVSIQASSTVGSRVQGIPKISSSAKGGAGLRSQFLGSVRIHIPCGPPTPQVLVHNAAKAGAICSASFFEKLGQLFSSDERDQEQILAVYEVNEMDRGSPIIVKGTGLGNPLVSQKPSLRLSLGLGDFVPYTNKVFDHSARVQLGLSAGLCTCIQQLSLTTGGVRYETTYTHYFDGFGQISAMGPYYSTIDSDMVVTGGTGVFKGARGTVHLHSDVIALKIKYTYHLTGIPKLPLKLTSR